MVKYNIRIKATATDITDFEDFKGHIRSLISQNIQELQSEDVDTIQGANILIGLIEKDNAKVTAIQNKTKAKLDSMVSKGRISSYEISVIEIPEFIPTIKFP